MGVHVYDMSECCECTHLVIIALALSLSSTHAHTQKENRQKSCARGKKNNVLGGGLNKGGQGGNIVMPRVEKFQNAQCNRCGTLATARNKINQREQKGEREQRLKNAAECHMYDNIVDAWNETMFSLKDLDGGLKKQSVMS